MNVYSTILWTLRIGSCIALISIVTWLYCIRSEPVTSADRWFKFDTVKFKRFWKYTLIEAFVVSIGLNGLVVIVSYFLKAHFDVRSYAPVYASSIYRSTARIVFMILIVPLLLTLLFSSTYAVVYK